MATTTMSPSEGIEVVLRDCKLTASRFAQEIGMSPQAVSFMRAGERSIPPEKVPLICEMSKGAVSRWHLRPDDWHQIWPELIGAEGAPPAQPAQQPATEGEGA